MALAEWPRRCRALLVVRVAPTERALVFVPVLVTVRAGAAVPVPQDWTPQREQREEEGRGLPCCPTGKLWGLRASLI